MNWTNDSFFTSYSIIDPIKEVRIFEFANAFMYLCKQWLKEGCRYTPQEFAAYSSGLLLHGLKDYLEHLTNYYELMRWHKLECSSEEYAKLYDKGVYEIEEMDALDRIKGTIEFLEKIKQS